MDYVHSLFLSETEQIVKYKRSFYKKVSRRVSFDNMAQVILIPCLSEYKSFEKELWYNDSDYERFKSEYIKLYFSFCKDK
jgi:hypothetical protein